MDIPLRPEVLRWARERARLDVETLAKRLGTSPARVSGWESDGRIRPKQVEKLARVTHTAVGLLYLPEPPVETLPVPDFRTLRDEEMRTPSPDLLDVIDQARQRQDWFRDTSPALGGLAPHGHAGSGGRRAVERNVPDMISFDAFLNQYREQQEFFRQQQEERASGGDFYNTQRSRTGERFARGLIESAFEGRTPYRDALRLLGMSNVETFHRFARELRFAV